MPACLLRMFLPVLLCCCSTSASQTDDLKILFLGDSGHHQPEARFQQLAPVLERRGIGLIYTDDMDSIQLDSLQQFDGLILYANIDEMTDAQAMALLSWVETGGAFIPLHCATYCWRNQPDITALMGARFLKHGSRIFSVHNAGTNHAIMQGYSSFSSWDETYIHHMHNDENRTVLEYRVAGEHADGQRKEPWTWIRTHGNGRVFYTAWGHDHRTWDNPGFHNLVERGIRWACGQDPAQAGPHPDTDSFTPPPMTAKNITAKPFEYVDVGPKIPNYTPGTRWGIQGRPHSQMQKPLPSEESIKHFVTPRGMSVRLYADERNFQAKPIAMTWDAQGRLWLCETVDYPNELGGNRDRIRICEDTDGDHVADRFTVFADGLSIPTTITMWRGGAVVQNGTETIWLKDTTGDDVADERVTLITDWALGDTHGGVNNFRFGLDNWIWAMQGYNNSTPHIDGKPTQTFRMGFFRFRLSQTDPPRVTDLEFIRSSNNNTWGLGISEEGLIFGSTANHNPSMFMPIPNRYYEQVRGWAPERLESIADTFLFDPITDNVRQVDQFGGYTAGAGHALYTARAFPQQWWNRTAFVCGPTGHLVGTFVLQKNGAGYSSASPLNLLASEDEWTAPVACEVGPDGAVWVLDWYNYIVQHNPTPQGFQKGRGNAYVSDLRDKKHGRIYRVVPTSDAGDADNLHNYVALDRASSGELITALKHPSMVWRLHAQRLLLEHAADNDALHDELIPQLADLVADRSVDTIGLNPGAIHAIHTLQGLHALRPESFALEAVQNALTHPSPGVRRSAIAVLPADTAAGQILDANLLSDTEAQCRLQAALSLADASRTNPLPSTAAAIVTKAASTTDPILLDALTAAAAACGTAYLRALTKDDQNQADHTHNVKIARRVAEHLARGKPPTTNLAGILEGMRGHSRQTSIAIVDGLLAGLPEGQQTNAETLDSDLQRLFEMVSAAEKPKIVRLARRLGSDALDAESASLMQSLVEVILNANEQDKSRLQAVEDVVDFTRGKSDVVSQFAAVFSPQLTADLAAGLLQRISESGDAQIGETLVTRLDSVTPNVRTLMIETLIGRPQWTTALLTALEDGRIQLAELTARQRQTLQLYPDEVVKKRSAAVLRRGDSLPSPDRDRVLQSLMHLTEDNGSIDRGRQMFKKHCAACHQHGKDGRDIGPNLTGMAVHPKAELLTHIIDPSRSVEGNFRVYVIVLTDGRVMNGMLAAETRTAISLVDTQGKEISLQRADIEDLRATEKSLMPDGFEKQIDTVELTDLLEFLTDKGRFLPLSLDRYATAISTRPMFHGRPNGRDRLIFPDWKPKVFRNIPFVLTNPDGQDQPNVILLHGPQGTLPPSMPRSVKLTCNSSAIAIHLLSGIGGWNYPASTEETVSMTVRLHYEDDSIEDHPLRNRIHFADYIRRVDVDGSEFAFDLQGRQVRYLAIRPKTPKTIRSVELRKGEDTTAPLIVAVTIER